MSDKTGTTPRRLFGGGRRTPKPGPAIDAVPWSLQVGAAWSWRILVIAGLVALILFLVVQLRYLVIPMLIAILLGALLVPVVDFLQRKGWPRWLGVTVTELGVIAAVTGLIYLVVTQVSSGMEDLARQSQEAWADLQTWLLSLPFGLTAEELDGFVAQAVRWIQEDSQALVNGAVSLGSTVGHVLAGVLLTLFATIFILLDGRGIWAWVVRLFPKRARTALDGGGKAGWISLGSFVRVQILVASIDAVGIGIGAAILGVPLAFPIAVLVFLGSFIPIVGAIATGAVAVFIALVYNGWVIALIMLGVVLLVQQLEGHVLQPLIMGTAVKIHPLAIVIAVTGGAMVAGISGALFAVPLVALLNSAISYIASGEWRYNPDPKPKDILPRV